MVKEKGLTGVAANLLLASWRPATKKVYNVYIAKWRQFASKNAVNELAPTTVDVANFLASLFEQGASYSTVNSARSALSAYLAPQNKQGPSIGSHPDICRLLKGVFEERPALPKYQEVWSVDVVLDHLLEWPHVHELSLKQLSLRTVILLTLLTGQRGHALHALNVSDVRLHAQKCTIMFSVKQKHTRPGAHTEPATILAFPNNAKLCLIKHLERYLELTKDLRQGDKLFISFIKPHSPISRETFSRWVKLVLEGAGIDTEKFGSHSTRAASTSAAANHGASLVSIMKAAGWSNQKTFSKFYNKTSASNFGQSVMDSFVKKQ